MSRDPKWNQRAGWFKSRHSDGSDNCLEVNLSAAEEIGVRDTKNAAEGPVLVVSRPAYQAFIDAIRAGQFTA